MIVTHFVGPFWGESLSVYSGTRLLECPRQPILTWTDRPKIMAFDSCGGSIGSEWVEPKARLGFQKRGQEMNSEAKVD